MEAGHGKIVEEPQVNEPSQEQMEEYFSHLFEKAHRNYFRFKNNVNWESFNGDFKISGLERKKTGLELRKLWVEMKQSGAVFNEFLAGKIRGFLDSKDNDAVAAYEYSQIYFAVNESSNYKFLAEMLDNEVVWNNIDGSLMHNLLNHIGVSENQEATEVIIKHIDHILSPEYQRVDNLEGDIDNAVAALVQLLGTTKTHETLQELAEKDPTFKGWFKKLKMEAQIGSFYYYSDNNLKTEKFDLKIEKARLARLQEEIKEFEKNPPLRWNQDELDDWPEPSFENEFKHDIEKEEPETYKLYNLHGRFTPKLKEGFEVNSENYLSGLFATVFNKRKDKEEDYLNFICGKIPEEFTGIKIAELSRISELSDDDLYRVAAAAFSRALSLSFLEQKNKEAISEIDILANYLETSVSGESKKASLFLAGELKDLQRIILERKDAPVEIPKSAEPFLIYHIPSQI